MWRLFRGFSIIGSIGLILFSIEGLILMFYPSYWDQSLSKFFGVKIFINNTRSNFQLYALAYSVIFIFGFSLYFLLKYPRPEMIDKETKKEREADQQAEAEAARQKEAEEKEKRRSERHDLG